MDTADNWNGGGYRWGYRDKARIISIVDIVMSTLNLGNTFLHFLAVSAYSSWLNSVDPNHDKVWVDFTSANLDKNTMGPRGEMVFAPHTVKKLAWMLVLAQFAINFSQLVFAINLYTGTARTAPAKAHSACRLWFITSSLLLGIYGIRIFFQHRDSYLVYNMSEIIFRAVGMYIVGEYAKQLKREGAGLIPPPVYFSSQGDGRHHGNRSGRGLTASYPVQTSIPIFFSPHHVESPPKYEETIQQIDANATVVTIPDTEGERQGQGATNQSGGVAMETAVINLTEPSHAGISPPPNIDPGALGNNPMGFSITTGLPIAPPKYEDIVNHTRVPPAYTSLSANQTEEEGNTVTAKEESDEGKRDVENNVPSPNTVAANGESSSHREQPS